jgi:hypothetical protein
MTNAKTLTVEFEVSYVDYNIYCSPRYIIKDGKNEKKVQLSEIELDINSLQVWEDNVKASQKNSMKLLSSL